MAATDDQTWHRVTSVGRPRMSGQVEDVFRQWGREALVEHAHKKLQEWEGTTVHLAVLGPVGAGKASFINTLRGIKEEDHPMSASVGDESEATKKSICFKFPNNPEINVWKLPSIVHENNTLKNTVDQYVEGMSFQKYDAFILLTCTKFTKLEKEVTEVIRKMERPFFLARTKTEDILIKNQNNANDPFLDTIAKEIRTECLNGLWKPRAQSAVPHVFLITTKQTREFFHDNENESLNQHIVDGVPEQQRTALGRF